MTSMTRNKRSETYDLASVSTSPLQAKLFLHVVDPKFQ